MCEYSRYEEERLAVMRALLKRAGDAFAAGDYELAAAAEAVAANVLAGVLARQENVVPLHGG